jgi:hypothetical protein
MAQQNTQMKAQQQRSDLTGEHAVGEAGWQVMQTVVERLRIYKYLYKK